MGNLCVLWSKEIVIFTLGCTTVSSEIIPQMADEPLTPVLLFFSERRNFFTLDYPSKSHETFFGFLCSLQNEDNSCFHDTSKCSETFQNKMGVTSLEEE